MSDYRFLPLCLHPMWQETFLYRVFRKDKALFGLFVFFILSQVFFTYKRVENTPFFHYGMYSAIHPPHDSYTVYSVVIDTSHVRSADFYDYQREVVYGSIARYDDLQHDHFIDPLDKVISSRMSGSLADRARHSLINTAQMDTPYQKWLLAYIADMRMVHNPKLKVESRQVRYRPDGSLTLPDSFTTLFQHSDE